MTILIQFLSFVPNIQDFLYVSFGVKHILLHNRAGKGINNAYMFTQLLILIDRYV